MVVLIPAYNEEKSIAKVIVGARKYADHIIVCDDGSTDMTGEIALALGASVIRNERNMGKGEALRRLAEAARRLQPKVAVTIDADGQHDPHEIPRLIEPILRGEADIVIGVRPRTPGAMPRWRALGNRLLDLMTGAKAGSRLHDTQSGFRAYSSTAIQRVSFVQRGMAIESQTLIDAAALGLRIREVPISVRYEGIAHKRNPLSHLSEVVDYLITRTVIESPLLYLGLPGLIAIISGIIAGIRVVDIFLSTRQIAVGTALISVILILAGVVALATSLILKLLTARLRDASS